jgi:hypothetical protein
MTTCNRELEIPLISWDTLPLTAEYCDMTQKQESTISKTQDVRTPFELEGNIKKKN